ncbi:6089_t:CDS:2, partial [Cetraspora pellucida]
IGVQGQFVSLPAPSSVCITGCTYHCILPKNVPNHSINWYLYDEQDRFLVAYNHKIPNVWILAVQQIKEVAAIIRADNIINIQLHSILIWRYTDIEPKFVNILSAQYEPLQYPLLFPHRTSEWYPYNYYNYSQIDWYHCHLLHEQRFLFFEKLTSEYLVEMYLRVEEE